MVEITIGFIIRKKINMFCKIIAGFELQGIGTILCIIIYYNKKARCISQGTVPFTPEKNRYTLWYENRSIEDYRLIIFV